MILTSDDYSKAVKLKYDQVKNSAYSEYLSEPTRSGLRELCLLFIEKELTNSDKERFLNFFSVNNEQDLKKSILNFDIEKFRSAIDFLKGRTEKTSLKNIELIAIWVDFEPRPKQKFLAKGEKETDVSEKNTVGPEAEEPILGPVIIPVPVPVNDENDIPNPIETIPSKRSNPRKVYIYPAVILLFLAGFFGWNAFPTEKQCMQWQNDHYETVDCTSYNPEFTTQVIALDTSLLKFRKIYPKKDSPFMSEGKITIWYCKNNGVEFFNADGKHPLSGKNLGPVSTHIMNKYGR